MDTQVWIFAYGSLIWRPDFEFEKRQLASLRGFERRFCQASHDHRGTPEQSGRVVTLAPVPAGACTGVAFGMPAEHAGPILRALDEREQDGYVRELVALELQTGEAVDALTWIAHKDNPSWRGGESLQAVATVIAGSAGPSGSNREYLFELDAALQSLGIVDQHVLELVAHVRSLRPDA